MKLSAKEKLALEATENRGGVVGWGALERKFHFTVSPIVTAGIDVAEITAMSDRLAALCAEMSFSLSGIVFFPIIVVDGAFKRDDFRSFKRASNGYYVGRNIDAKAWMGASAKAKRALFLKNLDQSISWIPDARLPAPEKDQMRAVVLESVK